MNMYKNHRLHISHKRECSIMSGCTERIEVNCSTSTHRQSQGSSLTLGVTTPVSLQRRTWFTGRRHHSQLRQTFVLRRNSVDAIRLKSASADRRNVYEFMLSTNTTPSAVWSCFTIYKSTYFMLLVLNSLSRPYCFEVLESGTALCSVEKRVHVFQFIYS